MFLPVFWSTSTPSAFFKDGSGKTTSTKYGTSSDTILMSTR